MQIKSGTYRHYKGQNYQVLGVVRHSETEEALVVYRCLYGDRSWWTRPLTMFTEQVEISGESVPRFEFIEAGPSFEQLVSFDQSVGEV